MHPLTPFEQQVLEAALQGPQPVLAALRSQIAHAKVSARTHTGVGSYIDFSVPQSVPRVSPTEMVFGDVDVQVEGVSAEVSTILYIVGGHLHFLEFAALSGEWPKEPVITKLGYLRSEKVDPDDYKAVAVDERDADTLERSLAGPAAKKKI